ncbi:MAG: hypothetical protein FJ398_07015 [Verrucomicrobia bacterium]|nr:hypothetical protein [Verrucomicrobiota bacterium]
MTLDHSVYPDLEAPPTELRTPEEKAEYVQRLCAQWDYGILPEPCTFTLLVDWKAIFDRYPIRHSPAYHAFRLLFGWEPVPGQVLRAGYEIDDLREGRTDPCVTWI